MTRKLPLFAALGLTLATLAACNQTQSGGSQVPVTTETTPPPAGTMTPAPATPPAAGTPSSQTAPVQ